MKKSRHNWSILRFEKGFKCYNKCCDTLAEARNMSRHIVAHANGTLALLPSATKLRRLYFYRRVSVHRGVGVSASVHAGIPYPPKSRHPLEQTPPEQTPPKSRHPPRSRHSPGADTPLPPERRRPLLRTVRILLECILVIYRFHKSMLGPTCEPLKV